MTQLSSQKKHDNSDKVDALSRIVCMRSDELIHELGIKLSRAGNKYIGCCPIHGGNNFGALNLYPDGHTVPGFWKCRTRGCQFVFKKTIVGFVRGVLSHQQYGWQKDKDKTVTFEETLNWLCKFINQDLNSIKIDVDEVGRRKFANDVNIIQKVSEKPQGIPKSVVRENLHIPARYYIDRKYSPEILSKYDVGYCDKQGREMCGRVVVPVYDNTGHMIGCTGRATIPKCEQCGSYHNFPSCPAEKDRWLYSKWKNSAHFLTGSQLYNYWNAKKYIQDSATVILVEGPGDVWRLEEAGIRNAVALFGCELTDEQQILLESSGAMNVIILLDSDDAGKKAVNDIKTQLQRFYNIHIPKINTKDIGDMTIEQVKETILPVIKGIVCH